MFYPSCSAIIAEKLKTLTDVPEMLLLSCVSGKILEHFCWGTVAHLPCPQENQWKPDAQTGEKLQNPSAATPVMLQSVCFPESVFSASQNEVPLLQQQIKWKFLGTKCEVQAKPRPDKTAKRLKGIDNEAVTSDAVSLSKANIVNQV